MISTLAWKDYREHLPVWAAMAGLAIFLIVVLTQVFAPHGLAAAPADKLLTIALAALILTASYGLICGAMTVAGETEARTQTFLDTLPATRMRLWITKVLMGTLLTLAQALVITGVLVALGLTEVKALPAGWQLALPLVGVEAFVYGLFGSVLWRSVLAACGWALVPAAVGWVLGGAPDWPPAAHLLIIRGILALCVLGLAGLIYCRHDLLRTGGTGERLPPMRKPERGWRIVDSEAGNEVDPRPPSFILYSESWRMLSWLAFRQGWSRFLLFAAAGFVTGLSLPNAALAVWPVASLLVGIIFGTGMFSGEQTEDAYRFLGSQRLPPGQVWLGKATAWAAMAAGVLGFLLLGALFHLGSARMPTGSVWRAWGSGQLLGSPLLFDLLPKEVFLLLWPVYGFSIGQFLALICRKSVVALVLSILIGVPVVGIWIPSLVGGGLKLWQVLPPAALLLLATRLGLWAWAGGLLKSRGPILGLVACAGLAGVWLAGTLVYRAVEIPDLGEPFDVKSYLASLPTPEQNRAGSLIRQAGRELMEQQRLAEEGSAIQAEPAVGSAPGAAGAAAMPAEVMPPPAELPPGAGPGSALPAAPAREGAVDLPAAPDRERVAVPPAPPDTERAAVPPATPVRAATTPPPRGSLGYEEPIESVLENGWPDNDAKLRAWLEPLCQGEWIDHLRQAAALPLGVVEDPRLANGSRQFQTKSVYELAAELLVARALQIQAAGDPASALDHLLWALALSRHLRYASTEASYFDGQRVEATAMLGLDRWLNRLSRNSRRGPELIRRAFEALNQHEAETPPATDPIRAEYCVLRGRLDDPARWLFTGANSSAPALLERDLVTLALQTTWEKERARRFLHALTISRLKEAQTPYWQLPLQARLGNRNSAPVDETCLVNFLPDGNHAAIASEPWERLLADSRLLLRLFVIWPRAEPLSEAYSLRRVRAARLKLALILYQIHEGKPAQRLAQLVPRYLEELPVDPFSGRQFRYGGSSVQIRGPDGEIRGMGQGILESTGPDGGGSFIVPSWPR